MADLAASRGGVLTTWQRQHLVTAVATLRERCGNPPADPKMRGIHDMILEVLDPPRRALRLQREMASSAHSASLTVSSERRRTERRSGTDRRVADVGAHDGVERRVRSERRTHSSRRAAA